MDDWIKCKNVKNNSTTEKRRVPAIVTATVRSSRCRRRRSSFNCKGYKRCKIESWATRRTKTAQSDNGTEFSRQGKGLYLRPYKEYGLNGNIFQKTVDKATSSSVIWSGFEKNCNKLGFPHFRDVFMKHTLPTKKWKTECGIVNMDSISGEGTHRTAYYKRHQHIIYLDSYENFPPPPELITYFYSDGSDNKIRFNYDSAGFQFS